MAVHERRSRHPIFAPLLIAGTLAGACSQASPPTQPKAAPPQSSTPSPAESTSPAKPAAAAVPALREDRVVVIDPGDEEATGEKSLAEVARDEKERRSRAAAPVAVITNRTLPAYAAKGQLTIATPGPQASNPEESPDARASELRDEQSWRSRGLEIRRRWRAAVDEIDRLEANAAGLRRLFYAEDDPYRRDGQIKPEWDRVLDHLEQTRAEAEAAEKELEQFLEEGRQAGALPGWLQDGAEEEPAPKADPVSPTEAIEPRELEEGPP